MSVSIRTGHTAFTLIPAGLNFFAIHGTMRSRAPFVAVYGKLPLTFNAAMDEICMTDPFPLFAR